MLIVGMLTAAAGSASAAGWLEPEDISAANEVVDGRPQMAVDSAGNAVAIWERHVGGEEIVEASERPAGGEWSEPEVLSLPGEEGQQSRVAIDASGTAIAVWITGENPTGFVVRSAARPAVGEWSNPEDVSDTISEAVTPTLALDATNEAVAIWTAFEDPDRIVQGAIRSADGEWSAPDDISETGELVKVVAEAPQVAIDDAGNAIAVWTLEDGDVVQAAVHPAGGDWDAPEDLSGAGQGRQPDVAMNGAGEAVAVWTRFDGTDTIQAMVRPAGGDWEGPDELSNASQNAAEPDVAMDETGEAVAVWTRSNGTDDIIQAAVRPAGGDWAEPDDLSLAGQNGTSPVVAANVAVGAVAVWERSDDTDLRVQAAVRSPGGEWPKPGTLSAAGEDAGFAEVALDAAGNAIAVFGRNGVGGPAVQATAYDFAAPRLSDLRVPAAGTVGERVTFGVSAFDVFPFATSWTFGDGRPGANGNTVSHVYTAPGVYPVVASAADGGGNTSTQIGAIAISAAPTKPPPPPPVPACIVPQLAGKKLARAKTALKAAGCKLGTVSKPKRQKGKKRRVLVVKSSNPGAGATPADGKVHVKLGPKPRKARR